MPRTPSPGGRKGDEKKVALVFRAEHSRYRNGINVTAAPRSNKAYNSQSTRRWVVVLAAVITLMLPTPESLDDSDAHKDERQRPANGTGISQITDLKSILIEIHHNCEPPIFGPGTVQQDKG